MGKCGESKTGLYASRDVNGSRQLIIPPATYQLLNDVNTKLSQTINGIEYSPTKLATRFRIFPSAY